MLPKNPMMSLSHKSWNGWNSMVQWTLPSPHIFLRTFVFQEIQGSDITFSSAPLMILQGECLVPTGIWETNKRNQHGLKVKRHYYQAAVSQHFFFSKSSLSSQKYNITEVFCMMIIFFQWYIWHIIQSISQNYMWDSTLSNGIIIAVLGYWLIHIVIYDNSNWYLGA